MHQRPKEVGQTRPLVWPDPALALEMMVAIGLDFSGMKHPVSGAGIVLQSELRAALLGRRWSFADDPEANALLCFGRI
jgi:hypothetical protein